jgi:glycosyltransferase involved in cell wall biosynthesis
VIDVTVAIPTWNSAKILWLALESLCLQQTKFSWELYILECASDDFAGDEYLDPYRDRLNSAGCVRIRYTSSERKLALGGKWCLIANKALAPYFLMAGSDDYKPPDWIERAGKALAAGAEWYDCRQGLFYDLLTGESATFDITKVTYPGMCAATLSSRVAALEPPYPLRTVDGWLKRSIDPASVFREETAMLGMHTDGANAISLQRRNRYRDEKGNFFPPRQTIEEIVPPTIMGRLLKFRV